MIPIPWLVEGARPSTLTVLHAIFNAASDPVLHANHSAACDPYDACKQCRCMRIKTAVCNWW